MAGGRARGKSLLWWQSFNNSHQTCQRFRRKLCCFCRHIETIWSAFRQISSLTINANHISWYIANIMRNHGIWMWCWISDLVMVNWKLESYTDRSEITSPSTNYGQQLGNQRGQEYVVQIQIVEIFFERQGVYLNLTLRSITMAVEKHHIYTFKQKRWGYDHPKRLHQASL